ncbi:MAG: peroxide stress protein YaaA [Actinomycetales bacterium]|nr:peroxide stress protein YaaA [Actinomycetales bacterium]
MLFLLPPSETKALGGSAMSIQQVALTFGGLNAARDAVYGALESLCRNTERAAKVLKLGAKQLGEIEKNLSVQTAPVMPALLRYTGTLYDAIHDRGLKGSGTENNSLSRDAIARAKELVLVQSSLFGLIPATDLIPEYRLSATTNLPGISLKKTWSAAHEPIWARLAQGPIIDMRSKQYAELAPIPDSIEHFELDVVLQQPDESRTQLNHFNKKAKGQLINAILTAAKAPETIAELQACAKAKGMCLECEGHSLTLVTFA